MRIPRRKKLLRAMLGSGSRTVNLLQYSPAAWYKPGVGVTGTLTASNWADQSGNGRDLAQGTAGNQPIYLPYTGTAYAYLPGVSGNYFSTPDSVANSITGDIDIRVYCAMDDWTPSAINSLFGKWDTTSDNRGYIVSIRTGGQIALDGSITGGAGAGASFTAISTAAVSFTNGSAGWIRVTRASASGNCNFYTSDDGSTWTLLGSANVTSDAGGLFNNTAVLQISDFNAGGGSQPAKGKVYRAQIYNGIGGTLAVDFNAADFAETSTNGATAVSSGTGETWTLNSTGAKPATVVKSPQLLFDGTASYMTANVPLAASTVYIVGKQVSWTVNDTMFAGNVNGINIYQVTSSPTIGLFAGSAACANSDLAVGSFGILSAVFNGAGSSLTVNNGTPSTGNAGTPNETTVTLGAAGGGGSNWANIIVKEIIAFPAAHDAATRAQIQSYLNSKYGVF